MLELAENVIKLTGSKSRLVFRDLPQDDPVQRKPVIDLAQEKLQWSPTINLEKGLYTTIFYFQQLLEVHRK